MCCYWFAYRHTFIFYFRLWAPGPNSDVLSPVKPCEIPSIAFLHTSVLFISLFLIPHPTPTVWWVLISCNSLACKFGVLRGLVYGHGPAANIMKRQSHFHLCFFRKEIHSPLAHSSKIHPPFSNSLRLWKCPEVMVLTNSFPWDRKSDLQIACFTSWHPLFSWPGSSPFLIVETDLDFPCHFSFPSSYLLHISVFLPLRTYFPRRDNGLYMNRLGVSSSG